MATRQDELAGAAPAIVTPDPWEELRRFTDARIGLGHCGVSLPVKRWLEFRLAHARARDAVMTPLDEEQVRAGLAAHGLECLSLSSAVERISDPAGQGASSFRGFAATAGCLDGRASRQCAGRERGHL